MPQRAFNRKNDEIRPLKITYDVYPHAAGSVLFEMGNTKILCSATLQDGVPHFLRGKGAGWLTAEYAMLPASTPVRSVREATTGKRGGRTIEISRLIGRSLRSVTNLSALGERTIFIDCDVLQADGSTRTACVTSAYLALRAAQSNILFSGGLSSSLLLADELAGISVGVTTANQVLLDIDYAEDSTIGSDFNFVFTRSGNIVEVQGTAEMTPVSREVFEQVRDYAFHGAQRLFEFFDTHQCKPRQYLYQYEKIKTGPYPYIGYDE